MREPAVFIGGHAEGAAGGGQPPPAFHLRQRGCGSADQLIYSARAIALSAGGWAMKRSVLVGLTSWLTLAATLSISSAATSSKADDGAWAERIQVIYLSASRSVERRTVKVWDPHPELKLDFVWEPASGQEPGIAQDGRITRKGRHGG